MSKKGKAMAIMETTLAEQLNLADGSNDNGQALGTDGKRANVTDDVAAMLQPLLEQEAQLE
jgi:hypothetical protein